ncbi:hypothetical protein SAMN05216304_10157 [Bosea sp. OK403]|uniref:ADYC domain-containing protein n=1 Tax=Bosea sp. OK403 TaxID=1855286 RepID=UPI0008EB70BD|nr:ADYC domain-containing protein [Bosea sp. OK403]SFH94113.1 hypothetical protein SAMN05216304_10157 [Bosea sp. OK403]
MPVKTLIAAIFLFGITSASAAQPAPLVEAEGTQLRVTLADGRVLHSPELIGATLLIATADGGAVRARLDALEADPDDKTGKVWLHSFSAQDKDGAWQPLCMPGPDKRQQGFPLAGRARADGSVAAAPSTELELVCTSGARGKCVRFGYHPWENARDGSPMLPLYNACMRMVRADYGGNDHPYTRNGMTIDIYDDLDVQKLDAGEAMPFEAGWSEQGAVCLAHPRVPENGSLADIASANPHLAGHLGPEACTEEKARALGAVLFNRSAASR